MPQLVFIGKTLTPHGKKVLLSHRHKNGHASRRPVDLTSGPEFTAALGGSLRELRLDGAGVPDLLVSGKTSYYSSLYDIGEKRRPISRII